MRVSAHRGPWEVTAEQLKAMGVPTSAQRDLLRSGRLEKTDRAGVFRWSAEAARDLASLVR